jgi:hypothetical protein
MMQLTTPLHADDLWTGPAALDGLLAKMLDLKALRIARQTGAPVEEVRRAMYAGWETRMRAFASERRVRHSD